MERELFQDRLDISIIAPDWSLTTEYFCWATTVQRFDKCFYDLKIIRYLRIWRSSDIWGFADLQIFEVLCFQPKLFWGGGFVVGNKAEKGKGIRRIRICFWSTLFGNFCFEFPWQVLLWVIVAWVLKFRDWPRVRTLVVYNYSNKCPTRPTAVSLILSTDPG